MSTITIGQAIRMERERLGMTAQEFGEAIGGASAMWVETYLESEASLENVTARSLLCMARVGANPLQVMIEVERAAAAVLLVDCGPRRIHVIKCIRLYCGFGLTMAKALTDRVTHGGPVDLRSALPDYVSDERVARFIEELRECGATVAVSQGS